MRLEDFAGVVLTALGLLLLLLIVAYIPTSLYADSKCLEAGYPRAAVSYKFKAYCMNMDGAVTVKVEELK